MLRVSVLFILLCLSAGSVNAQKMSVNALKSGMEQATDPVTFLKKSKRKYRLDTVIITSNKQFFRINDSLGYHGKIKKVYGPYGDTVMFQILAKAPNIFYRASHILLDTPKLNTSVARKLSDTILARIRRKATNFEDMARIYNTDGSGPVGGDLGWRARGTLIPNMENAILKRKKGEIVKAWSPYGLHIIKVTGTPVQDIGFAIIVTVYTE